METRYPIRKADGTEYQRYEEVKVKLGNEQAGKWLVANNYLWHGGIHISGKSVPHAILTAETAERAIPLQCMTGGKIVALRVSKEYKEAPYGENQKINYSSTFVLVRSTHTPDSSKPNSALTFYTLYMHLAPLSDYPERNFSRVIEPKGLKKRAFTSHETVGQPTSETTDGTFARGTLVEVGRTMSFTHKGASKEFCAVRKVVNGKPEGDYFWVAAGEENLQPQSKQYAYLPEWMQEAVRTDTYDSVIIPASPIDISAGSPIGFLGRDDEPNVRDEVQTDWQSHIEVFSNDSKMPRFLSNPENLTSNDKGYIKAKEGAAISLRKDVDNVTTFIPTEKTVSKDETWRVVEPEKSIPIKDAEGKWWFRFDKDAWLSQEDVDELNPYNLIARNFKTLEQPATDDFSKTLVEPWVSKAFRWFGSTEPTDEKQHFLWEGSAILIDNYTGGSIEQFMFKHLRGLLLDRLNFQDEGIAELRRRLIIKHDSEWYGKSEEPYWKKILDECGDKERPWLTQWRDDVEWMSQVEGFKEKAQRQLWHFHPLEFLVGIQSKARRKRRDYDLGSLSSRYETGGRGSRTVSGGTGDAGGVSYGAYQMTSKTTIKVNGVITTVIGGTVKQFISDSSFTWQDDFNGLVPGSSAFTQKWKELVDLHTDDFKEVEHEYIKKTHFDVLVEHTLSETNVDIRYHSHTLNDVVWSTAVHHGPKNSVIIKSIKAISGEVSENKSYDEQLIEEIYKERGKKKPDGNLAYFSKNSPEVQEGVSNRFINEKKDALERLKNETDY